MPTLVGARRRGFTPEGFRLFAERIGVSKADSWIDMSVLEDCMRDDLNARAQRRIAVLDPVKLVIDNYPEGRERGLLRAQPSAAARSSASARCRSTRELWIERDDYTETPPKGYFRLTPGAEVRLRYGYIVRCTGAEKDAAGNVTRRPLHVRPGHAQRHAGRGRAQGQGQHPLAVRGARGAGRSAALRPAVPRAVPRRAQSVGQPRRCGGAGRAAPAHHAVVAGDEDDDVEVGRAQLPRRPQSRLEAGDHRVRRAGARARPRPKTRFQFERHGYFVADLADHAPGTPGVQPRGDAQGLLDASRAGGARHRRVQPAQALRRGRAPPFRVSSPRASRPR